MSRERDTPAAIVGKWWEAIDRRDFEAASRLCSARASVEWPLSNERMASIENWRLVNEHYPGRWNASITDLVAHGDAVVTVTRVFNDQTSVTALSFFTIHEGQIRKVVEYWPEPYAPPEWRSPWTEPIS